MIQSPIKLTRGVPPTQAFPTAELRACADVVLARESDVVLQYGQGGGYPPLRAHLAEEYGVDDERVIVGQGSLQLLDLIARTLLILGDLVYAEAPTYDRTLTTLRRAGARVVGWPVSNDGVDVAAVERALEVGHRPILFYLIPDFQNPSGSVLSLEKRERLVGLARDYDFWLVEDAPYRPLRYRGEELPALFDLAPERVLLLSSYSKLISPGLRVGYAVAPPSLARGLARSAEDTYINASYLNQAIVHEFIRRGMLEPQIAALQALYRPRLDAMLTALDRHMGDLATWQRPDGGFFVGMTLREELEASALRRQAEELGLALTNGRGFFADGDVDGFVRLPFCALAPDEIEEGVARLERAVRACRVRVGEGVVT
jgi:DNA-binding transcriptional MocR family regulator